jgi:alginate O-acetyltransferase complex protein AlgI
MLFSSIPFLYFFLPAVLLLYFIAPRKLKNAVLLVSSLFFYAWGEPVYVILMAVTIILGYISGLFIENFRKTKTAKLFLALSLFIILGFLGYFKYADFFIDNFNKLTSLSVNLLHIALPIGISFYTFQLISYLIDVYRGDISAQKNIISLAAYITMFPQLIAGPIVRYSDIEKQLKERTLSLEGFSKGITRFVIGLGKKVIIANQLGLLIEIFRESNEKSVLFYWIYAISFCLHIYFDFSGYSDMAIGLGKILGFDFCENFNYPFISKSVSEFWRRWHMSLGSWFRDYVYIPLGGNRAGKFRWIFNVLTVWMLTGLWHGADWVFVVWGLYFAVLLVLEKQFQDFLKKHKIISGIYVAFAIIISFVLFNATDIKSAFIDIRGLFDFIKLPLFTPETLYYLKSYAILLIAGIIGSTPIIKNLTLKINEKAMNILQPIFVTVVLILVTAYLVDGSFNPFLYFRF